MAAAFQFRDTQGQLTRDRLHARRLATHELGEDQALEGCFYHAQAGWVAKVRATRQHAFGAVEAGFLAADEGQLADRLFHQLHWLPRAGVEQAVMAHVIDERRIRRQVLAGDRQRELAPVGHQCAQVIFERGPLPAVERLALRGRGRRGIHDIQSGSAVRPICNCSGNNMLRHTSATHNEKFQQRIDLQRRSLSVALSGGLIQPLWSREEPPADGRP